MPFTVAWVPTGMKTGVSTTPWARCSRPRRARVLASLPRTSNFMMRNDTLQCGHPQESAAAALRPCSDPRRSDSAYENGSPMGGLIGVGTSPSRTTRSFLHRIGNRNGADQRLRIGMLRIQTDLFRGSDFHELSQIHHADPVGNLLDHRNGVRDEKDRSVQTVSADPQAD